MNIETQISQRTFVVVVAALFAMGAATAGIVALAPKLGGVPAPLALGATVIAVGFAIVFVAWQALKLVEEKRRRRREEEEAKRRAREKEAEGERLRELERAQAEEAARLDAESRGRGAVVEAAYGGLELLREVNPRVPDELKEMFERNVYNVWVTPSVYSATFDVEGNTIVLPVTAGQDWHTASRVYSPQEHPTVLKTRDEILRLVGRNHNAPTPTLAISHYGWSLVGGSTGARYMSMHGNALSFPAADHSIMNLYLEATDEPVYSADVVEVEGVASDNGATKTVQARASLRYPAPAPQPTSRTDTAAPTKPRPRRRNNEPPKSKVDALLRGIENHAHGDIAIWRNNGDKASIDKFASEVLVIPKAVAIHGTSGTGTLEVRRLVRDRGPYIGAFTEVFRTSALAGFNSFAQQVAAEGLKTWAESSYVPGDRDEDGRPPRVTVYGVGPSHLAAQLEEALLRTGIPKESLYVCASAADVEQLEWTFFIELDMDTLNAYLGGLTDHPEYTERVVEAFEHWHKIKRNDRTQNK